MVKAVGDRDTIRAEDARDAASARGGVDRHDLAVGDDAISTKPETLLNGRRREIDGAGDLKEREEDGDEEQQQEPEKGSSAARSRADTRRAGSRAGALRRGRRRRAA